jgi:KaiC/GvpD/RAD55 family RecA-like ATPase
MPLGAPLADAQRFLRSLFFSLEDNLECTVLMTAHTSYPLDQTPAAGLAETLASGLFELKRSLNGRSLIIHKMRGTCIDQREHPLQIVRGRGIVL